MSNIDSLRTRNAAFAATDVRHNAPRLPFLPQKGLYVITCIDPRVDPADFLGLEFGEAIVARTVGGRVTPAIIQDADVERLLSDPRISPRITVSGHVYDVRTGLVTTIVDTRSPKAPTAG